MMVECVVKKTIDHCWHECPYFQSDMDGMSCGHPFFDGKGYDNMIISWDEDIKNSFPSKCPLLKEKQK